MLSDCKWCAVDLQSPTVADCLKDFKFKRPSDSQSQLGSPGDQHATLLTEFTEQTSAT